MPRHASNAEIVAIDPPVTVTFYPRAIRALRLASKRLVHADDSDIL
jgi:hypothetical protein